MLRQVSVVLCVHSELAKLSFYKEASTASEAGRVAFSVEEMSSEERAGREGRVEEGPGHGTDRGRHLLRSKPAPCACTV